MSNDMKLIMESFRKNVIQEEELQTVGSVLAIIQKFRQAKAGGDVGKKALEMAVEQSQGLIMYGVLLRAPRKPRI